MVRVKKAIIPAAGLGTRFLPATKTIPKEMLPIVDRPSLWFIVKEAVESGIEDIVIIAGRNKTAIEDFFDRSYELEDVLEKKGELDLLKELLAIREMANIISIRQKEAQGLGHAVLCGEPIVGGEPFAVLLGDEIMIHSHPQKPVTAQLIETFDRTHLSTVAVMEVPPEEVSRYGIVELEKKGVSPMRVRSVVEKPSPEKAPSRWALPGRYIFTPSILAALKNASPGRNGEIQLTDAMTMVAQEEGLIATPFVAERYDAGDKMGYLRANIEVALSRPDLGPPMKKYLMNLVKQWEKK